MRNIMRSNIRPVKKSICHWTDKNNDFTHYRNFKLYVEIGMNVYKKIKVMNFNKKKKLKPYIDLNTDLRSKAQNKYQKNICRSMKDNLSRKFVDVRKMLLYVLLTKEK